jgi:predicted membrane channel-forming protein YqfA (hemolysin III family)
MKKKKKHNIPLKHKIALFIVYLILFMAIISLINYYADGILKPSIFISLSLLLALISTFYHVKSKQKSKADELAREIEEIV